jgi:hypothetical protein
MHGSAITYVIRDLLNAAGPARTRIRSVPPDHARLGRARCRIDDPRNFYNQIAFWKTPLPDCGHDHRGPPDLLCRDRLQQRHRPAPTLVSFDRGSECGPRRGHLADVPLRHAAGDRHRATGGGLLAFALSFDEVIVTTFTAGTQQTLPIWILTNLRLPNQRPIVNVVAVVLILLSMIPVHIAQRLASDTGGPGSRS